MSKRFHYGCNHCPAKFDRRREILEHTGKYKCSYCDYFSCEREFVDKHFDEIHPEIKCNDCDFITHCLKILFEHSMFHRKDLVNCLHCDYYTHEQKYLDIHLNNHHPELNISIKRKYEDDDDYEFTENNDDEVNLTCHCGLICKSISGLSRHKKIKHSRKILT